MGRQLMLGWYDRCRMRPRSDSLPKTGAVFGRRAGEAVETIPCGCQLCTNNPSIPSRSESF